MVSGAAAGHTELLLSKGPRLCQETKGVAKPQTMKTILNERLNERKKSCQNVKANVFIELTRERLDSTSANL